MDVNTEKLVGVFILLFCSYFIVAEGQSVEIQRILSKCHMSEKNFDTCMKKALNDIRPYFQSGMPEFGVSSFDPHFAKVVEQRRGGPNANYHLILRNVYERGWSISKVTKFKTDWKNHRIIYTQYFPEKSLNGDYELNANAFGNKMSRDGVWNLTLYDYAQTTTITRKPNIINGVEIYDGQPLDVHVEIDRIGNMQIHVSNILNGANILENVLDSIINASWRPGFAVIRPLINDLVSTAFTDIWTESFKNFPFTNFIPE